MTRQKYLLLFDRFVCAIQIWRSSFVITLQHSQHSNRLIHRVLSHFINDCRPLSLGANTASLASLSIDIVGLKTVWLHESGLLHKAVLHHQSIATLFHSRWSILELGCSSGLLRVELKMLVNVLEQVLKLNLVLATVEVSLSLGAWALNLG